MIHFRPLGHLETFAVIARLHRFISEFSADGLLELRSADGKDTPRYKEWKSLRRGVSAIAKSGEIGRIWIDRLDANSAQAWLEDGAGFNHFVVALVTNPLVRDYRLDEFVHMPVGAIWVVNPMVNGGSANWGHEPRYHLHLEWRGDDAQEDPSA